MRNRSALVALLSAVLMAAGGMVGCDQQPDTTSGDPRVEGVMPHPLPAADTSILGPQGGGRRGATAATPARPTPAVETGPGASAALPSKTDHSSPKATLKAMFASIEANDLAAIKACFVTPANDQEKDLLENGVDSGMIQVAIFFRTLDAKFPGQNKGGSPTDMKVIDSATEEINGDKAVLKPANPGQPPFNFVKVGEEWKFPIEQDAAGGLLHKKSDTEKAASKELEEALAGLVSDLNAGKFTGADDAMAAMMQKTMAVAMKYAPAFTTPATMPAAATTPAVGG